jgi:hypothetical protein
MKVNGEFFHINEVPRLSEEEKEEETKQRKRQRNASVYNDGSFYSSRDRVERATLVRASRTPAE